MNFRERFLNVRSEIFMYAKYLFRIIVMTNNKKNLFFPLNTSLQTRTFYSEIFI